MPSWTCWAVDFRKKCFLTRFYTLTLCNVYKGVLVEEKNLEAFLPAAGSPLGTTGPFKCPRRFRQGNPTQSLPALAQSDGWAGRLDYIDFFFGFLLQIWRIRQFFYTYISAVSCISVLKTWIYLMRKKDRNDKAFLGTHKQHKVLEVQPNN